MKGIILVIDSDNHIRESIKKSLELDGFHVLTAENKHKAVKVLSRNIIDFVICDTKFPFTFELELINFIIKNYKYISIIVLTFYELVQKILKDIPQGIYDFITKPVNFQKLILLLEKSLFNKKLEHKDYRDQLAIKSKLNKIIGNSQNLMDVFNVVRQVAPSNANVLIYGENGTGKELIANAIHSLSKRKFQPIIKVHCAALNENLLESELFGHEKGAFTGASFKKKGRFEMAHNGTLFLDEIGEISPMLQVKLLRVLQEREFERVGGETTINVNVRLITATNRNLIEAVNKNLFREDLYFRLNVIQIHIPPLRKRVSDIPLLAESFIKEFCKLNNKKIYKITQKALDKLSSYHWPGNIRQLRNVIESCVVMNKGDFIREDNLPDYIKGSNNEYSIKIKPGLSMKDIEKQVILTTLMQTKGNKTKTADILKISRKTLYRKLSEYDFKE